MWPALIGVLGSLAASGLSWANQRRSERWQERQANSAHQREIEDLRRAGLNPILSGTGGRGAGMASVQPVRFDNPFEDFTQDVATAKRVENENKLLEEQREKLRAETEVLKKQPDMMANQMLLQDAQTALAWTNNKLTRAKVPKEEVLERVFRILGNSLDKYFNAGKKDQTVDGVLQELFQKLGFGSKEPEEVYREWKASGGSPHPKHNLAPGERPHGQGSVSGSW